MTGGSSSDAAAAGAHPATRHRAWSSLLEAGTEIWQSRELLFQLALRDIRIRYKQAVMGFGWAILMPVMIVGAGLIMRVVIARATGVALDTSDFGAMAAKAVCWSFFAGGLGFATGSLVANVNLVSKIYFPREVLPLASIAAQLFDTVIATAALAVALPFLGFELSATLAWLPVLALLLVTLTAASGLFLSCANLFFRDVKYIVQLLLTFGIFFTPVLIEPSMLGAQGAKLMMLNPLAPILEGVRLVLSGHGLLDTITEQVAGGVIAVVWQPWYLVYSAAWALGGFLASLLMFHRLEFIFAEYL